MTACKETQASLARRIAICDGVVERLVQLDAGNTQEDLIADVRSLRASLAQRLEDRGGSEPPV